MSDDFLQNNHQKRPVFKNRLFASPAKSGLGQPKAAAVSEPEKKIPEDNILSRFRETEAVPLEGLKVGVWYVKWKPFFRQILIIVLIALNAVFWLTTIFLFGDYLFHGWPADRQQMAVLLLGEQSLKPDLLQSIGPRDLVYFSPQLLPAPSGRYDFYVRIQNPNDHYFARFDYEFNVDGQTVGRGRSFVLPSDRQEIVSLGNELYSPSAAVKFVLGTVQWQRLDNRQIGAWPAYRHAHLDLPISNIFFTPAYQNYLSDRLSLNQLNFTISNKTAYGYYEVGLVILCREASGLAAVNYYQIDKLSAGETKSLEMVWPGLLRPISEVEIVPVLDIFNESLIIPPAA